MKKHSLLKQILLILFVILIISLTLTEALRYLSFRAESRRGAEETTSKAAVQLAYTLKKEDIDACLNDPHGEKAAELRQDLRSVCIKNGFRYIYVYAPDFDSATATYYFAVAADEKINNELLSERTAGTVVTLNDDILNASYNAWIGSGDITSRYENKYGYVAASYAALTENGENYALIGVECNAEGITAAGVREFTVKAVIGLITYIALFIIIAVTFRRRLARPILHISERMSRFADDIDDRDFTPIELHTADEIETVAESFNSMATEINSYIDEVKRFVAEEARLSTEFEVARHIQYGVVAARTDTELSDVYTMSGRMCSAKSVGGDFYDRFTLADGRHCVLIGDVSGKGIGAAMFMMHVKAILREKLMSNADISMAMHDVNDQLCEDNPENMFATVFAAIFDDESDSITFVNAGHNTPIIIRDGEASLLTVNSGIALGLFEDMEFNAEKTYFPVSDVMFLYTDGATDCVNEKNEFWTSARLLSTLTSCGRCVTTAEYCDSVLSALDSYRGTAEPFDDITLVCVKNNANKLNMQTDV